MLLKFKLDKDGFTFTNPADLIAAESIDYIKCHFDITDTVWKETDAIIAVFKSATYNKHSEVLLDSYNNCYIDPEVYKRGGRIQVKLVGDKYLNDTVISSTTITSVLEFNINENIIVPLESPSKYSIAIAELEKAKSSVDEALTDLAYKLAHGELNGVGIDHIVYNLDGTVTITLSDGTVFTSEYSMKGATGNSGVYYGPDEPTDPDIFVWVNPDGEPTFDPLYDIIDAWMEAHPEATTTVLDGSLTKSKFSDELKLQSVKDYVTPQMYGAKGDGIADDTDALQACIDENHYVKLPKGTYLISRPITVSHSVVVEGFDVGVTGLPDFNISRNVLIKGTEGFDGDALFILSSVRNCRFSFFTVDAGRYWSEDHIAGSAVASNCFKLTNSPYNEFVDINFKGASDAAFKVLGVVYTLSFHNCTFATSKYGYDSHECPDHCTNGFYNCRFDRNDTAGLLLTGRMIGFYNCAFENNIGDGVQLGYSGLDTYVNVFYNCDVENNDAYGIRFNTVTNGIVYEGGQIIGKTTTTNDLIYLNSAADNLRVHTHMAVLNNEAQIYDPTGVNIWIRGDIPEEWKDCIHVGNVYWSPLGSKKRDNYVDYTFTTDDISDIIPASGSHGAVATISKGFKLQIGGKAVSKITGVVSPVPASGKLLVKYHRSFNGGDKTAVNNCVATVAADGTFTLDSSIGVWGAMDSIFICPTWAQGDTNTYQFTNLVGKLR